MHPSVCVCPGASVQGTCRQSCCCRPPAPCCPLTPRVSAPLTPAPAVVKAPSVEKTLRLVISSRLVDRKKFLDALDERLAPRLKEVRRLWVVAWLEKGQCRACTVRA